LDEDSPIGLFGGLRKDALIVQVSKKEQQTVLWVVNGSVENALVTKGVRSRVYRMADLNLGCYVQKRDSATEEAALWYEGNTLRIHVAFKKGRLCLFSF